MSSATNVSLSLFSDVADRPHSSSLTSRHDILTPIVTPREEPGRPYTPELSVEDIPPSPQPQVLVTVHHLSSLVHLISC